MENLFPTFSKLAIWLPCIQVYRKSSILPCKEKRQCGCCVELRVIFENLRLKLYCCVLHAGCLLLTARSRANNIPNKIGAQVTSCRRGHGPRGDCQCITYQSNQFTHLYTVSKDIKYRGHNTCLSVLLEVITNKQYLGNSIGGQLTK